MAFNFKTNTTIINKDRDNRNARKHPVADKRDSVCGLQLCELCSGSWDIERKIKARQSLTP